MQLDLVLLTLISKQTIATLLLMLTVTYRACFCSFRDENGDRYSALTTLSINGEDVLAINSPRVLNTV